MLSPTVRNAVPAVSFAFLVGVAACGSDSPSEPVETNSVSVEDNVFVPDDIVVSPGETVSWGWSGINPHDVTWNEADLPAAETQTSGSHEVTMPSTPGEYEYHCTVHVNQGMTGIVRVE